MLYLFLNKMPEDKMPGKFGHMVTLSWEKQVLHLTYRKIQNVGVFLISKGYIFKKFCCLLSLPRLFLTKTIATGILTRVLSRPVWVKNAELDLKLIKTA